MTKPKSRTPIIAVLGACGFACAALVYCVPTPEELTSVGSDASPGDASGNSEEDGMITGVDGDMVGEGDSGGIPVSGPPLIDRDPPEHIETVTFALG